MIGSWTSDQIYQGPTTTSQELLMRNPIQYGSSGLFFNNNGNNGYNSPLIISTTASSVGDTSFNNNNNNNNNYYYQNNNNHDTTNQNYYYYSGGGGPQLPEFHNPLRDESKLWMTFPFNYKDASHFENTHKRKFDEYVNYLEENEEEEDIIDQLITDEESNKFLEDDPSSCLLESFHERNFCKRVKSQHHQDRLSAQLSHLHVSEESNNTSSSQQLHDDTLNQKNNAENNDMDFNVQKIQQSARDTKAGDWSCTQLVCCSSSSLTTSSLLTSCIPKTKPSPFFNGGKTTLNVSTDNQMMKNMWQKKLSSLISQSTGNSSNPLNTLLCPQQTSSTSSTSVMPSPRADTALLQSVLGNSSRHSSTNNIDDGNNPNEHAVVPYTSSREEILKRLRTRFDSSSNGKCISPKVIDDPHSTGLAITDASYDLMTDEN
ncbi:hypothetical protein FDP41_007631 [Naegleria fowleri]|uniref:Uncharacterized protein n=1 Tax=Naegleria fowleri TaxID=5763 RepID=A0A6A5C7H8_NAEFO|nr:uncharacterized protein FDP41_007631 [Naegleria fowleri]KAF0983716.1 hypothetical protein FDP41_007631 [Naegleria fowleri]